METRTTTKVVDTNEASDHRNIFFTLVVMVRGTMTDVRSSNTILEIVVIHFFYNEPQD